MNYLAWDPSFSVGNDELDDHHKHLISLLNHTQQLVENRADVEAVHKLLLELLDYSVIHFWVEETWMEEMGYPFRRQHVAQHRIFTNKIRYISERYAAAEADLAVLEIFIYLQGWLTEHIMGSDRKIGTYALLEGIPLPCQAEAV